MEPDTGSSEVAAGESTPPATAPGRHAAPSLVVAPRTLNVREGSSGSYTLALGAQPTGPVTVTATASSTELTPAPAKLLFSPGDWHTPRQVTVTARHDADTAPDVPARITHDAAGGGYDGVSAIATVTIVEDDVSSLAITAARAGEPAGRLRFEVTLSRASDSGVTVDFDTESPDETATGGIDYIATSGMLRFPPGSTASHTIEVAVLDDHIDEPEEQLSVTLRNPRHAILAGGAATVAATGTIEDDDQRGVLVHPTALTVQPGGSVTYSVVLASQPTAPVTVQIDVPQGGSIATDPARLTFDANWHTAQTVTVSAAASATVAAEHAITHRIGGGDYAGEAASAVTATISEPDKALELSALSVTGSGTMQPAFSAAIRHYGIRCNDGDTLTVAATSLRSRAQLTLLRDDPTNNASSLGSLTAQQVTVDDDHDIAIELSDGGETVTYVVHCIPPEAFMVRVLRKTDGATGGLLLVWAGNSMIVDSNGVIRHYLSVAGRNLQHYVDGPTIDGRQVAYSLIHSNGARLMDANLAEIRTVKPPARLPLDDHDFILGDDRYWFIAYLPATRDFTDWGGENADPVAVEDSVIVEMLFDGTVVKEWNSWDYLKIVPDCGVLRFPGEYAHLNSLQLVDDDIIASFRGCAQVVRIDRSSGSWALEWKLGGTARDGTEFLEIVDDDLGEFCGQHHATLYHPVGKPYREHIVMFDNGTHCLGSRKNEDEQTRVVEYDISSTTQAQFVRHYVRNERHGISVSRGGVTVLPNGNWLIAWGTSKGYTEPSGRDVATITEVDTAGNAVFDMSITASGAPKSSYRVYHVAEESVTLPLNLP